MNNKLHRNEQIVVFEQAAQFLSETPTAKKSPITHILLLEVPFAQHVFSFNLSLSPPMRGVTGPRKITLPAEDKMIIAVSYCRSLGPFHDYLVTSYGPNYPFLAQKRARCSWQALWAIVYPQNEHALMSTRHLWHALQTVVHNRSRTTMPCSRTRSRL